MMQKDYCANSKDLVFKKPHDQLKRIPSELGDLSVRQEHVFIYFYLPP